MSALAEENTILAAENARLIQEIQRQAQEIRALHQDPAHLHVRMCIQDDQDRSFFHVVHGSREGLDHVLRAVNARRDLRACHIALDVAGREAAFQFARANELEAALARGVAS